MPQPASNSSLLVAGDVNVICCVRDGGPISPWPSASGDVVGLGNPFCGPAPLHGRQIACSSQNAPNFARGGRLPGEPDARVLPRAIVERLAGSDPARR